MRASQMKTLNITTCRITMNARNRDLYESNSEIHNINTRFSSDLHTPTANLTTFQKGPFILESRFLITFLLASKIHLMT